jgi:Holliday junction DNA helicase RuvA
VIYTITGNVAAKRENSVVVEAGGFGFLVSVSGQTFAALPPVSSDAKLFCHLAVREDHLELYGFATEAERSLFELLIGVSGVGPKSALNVLGLASVRDLNAAIAEAKPELLIKASGIGKKTAERIIVELKNKVVSAERKEVVAAMEANISVEDALINLGYSRAQARDALSAVPQTMVSIEARLKEALKNLHKNTQPR